MKSSSECKPAVIELHNVDMQFDLDLYRAETLKQNLHRLMSLEFLKRRPQPLFSALKNLSVTICEGEKVGLIGINGSGKTTLCRVLTGLYTPTKGKAKIAHLPRALFSIGTAIQPELSGRENVEYLTRLLFPFRKRYQDIIEEILEFSELGEFVDVPFEKYSNGMKTRLCLSLISSRPDKILILDEIFNGADGYFAKKISERFLHIIEKSGTVLFVSHSLPLVELICERTLVLHKGEIVFDGKSSDAIQFYRENILKGLENQVEL